MILCKDPQTQHPTTRNVSKEGVQKTRQENQIKQQMIGTSERAKMEKIFEAFTFGAVSLHHQDRRTLSHSHYCLICACGLTSRENRRLFHINPTFGKCKNRILLRTGKIHDAIPHILMGAFSWLRRGGRRILLQHRYERILYRLPFLIVWTVKASNESLTTYLWFLLPQ